MPSSSANRWQSSGDDRQDARSARPHPSPFSALQRPPCARARGRPMATTQPSRCAAVFARTRARGRERARIRPRFEVDPGGVHLEPRRGSFRTSAGKMTQNAGEKRPSPLQLPPPPPHASAARPSRGRRPPLTRRPAAPHATAGGPSPANSRASRDRRPRFKGACARGGPRQPRPRGPGACAGADGRRECADQRRRRHQWRAGLRVQSSGSAPG